MIQIETAKLYFEQCLFPKTFNNPDPDEYYKFK